MIKVVVARYEGDSYESFLKPYVENKYEVCHVFNSEHNDSIFRKYNTGIEYYISGGLHDDDVVAFIHGDVKLLDPQFEDKVSYIFDQLPKLGVAGVIGATELHETAGWWLSDASLHRGHLMQWVDRDERNKYHMTRTIGNYSNLCVVDGLCMLVRGSVVKKVKFDDATYPKSYNFYDYDYCLSCKEAGYTVGVFDILVEHGSAGTGIYQDDWKNNKEVFLNKWKNKGYSFPLR